MIDLREAAQMALDALEDMFDDLGPMQHKTIEALRVALAQPEQEPVAYCYTWDVWISGGYWEARYGWEPYCGGKRPAHSTEAKPLYTAPPQREWVGLTDEEKYLNEARSAKEIEYAKAIEAKLKEKNA